MADRFPIIVDTSGIAALKELPAGDNLNLLNSGVVNAGAVDLTTITVSGSQGSDGQVLTSTGSGVAWENASAGGISDIVSDTSPQLGGTLDANSNNIDMGTNVLTDANLGNFITAHGWGNHASAGYLTSTLADTSPQLGGALDVNGQDIVSTSNAAIDLDPHGSGVVVFKGNATKGAGQFKLNCESNTHGVIIKGPPHSAAANYTLTLPTTDGNADQTLKTDGSGVLSWADAGGGGAWTVISSTTVSSAVASVEFTLSGYENYALKFTNLNTSGNSSYSTLRLQFSVDGGSNYLSTVYATRRHMGSYDSTSTSYHGRDNQVGDNHLAVTDVYHGASVASGNPLTSSNTDGMVYIYNNKAGVNNKTGIFHAIDSRGYNVAANINPFFADGAYVVTNSSVINKVKWLLAGNNSYNISHGTYTLYGISTS